ncbi:MAG: hypothetical protein NMK33_02100 [Candidatus Cardinium sp.]|uniref:hypothetical protein n=1 Tax=Cardinium endosymbiont of Dermatophagoides farinae TaxID=2597823 RepID=UPI001181FE06|nr:hypothetical protein [Cardinium endosymbiont of Dermatophagoides farinae]TSJ81275.1 hypothetical protein FPG78_04775 [Cardinium endosymbiont of Dermatophagoides farinae]UWW97333.1 MAG: hypothetical protein NMK33_02100 [Candidatus Cardinium sp.]
MLGIETIEGSIGEQHWKILLNILQNSKHSLLLLDEWDSALDHLHTKAIDERLDALAHDNTILEVRHKHIHDIAVENYDKTKLLTLLIELITIPFTLPNVLHVFHTPNYLSF